MKTPPEKGKKYEIRYKGMWEYDGYEGTGIFTGNTEDVDGMCYEFILEDGGDGLFPLKDVFPCNV